jgi:hypothetical protein
MRRRRRLDLLLVGPDGSRSWIPAAWTDLGGEAGPPAAGTLGSPEDLLAMRRVLDGVLRAGPGDESPGESDVVLAGRDDLLGEQHGVVAFGSGGVPGVGGGAVGAGGLRAARGGDRAVGGADRAERRGRGDAR